MSVTGSAGFAGAVMTGTVLHSDDPDLPKRAPVIFAAQDNSNSPVIRQDIITPLFINFFAAHGDCSEGGEPLTMFQVGFDAITIEP